MKFHHTDDAPKAIGPYSQAVSVDGWLYTSGQVALDPATGELVGGGFEAQARRSSRISATCWRAPAARSAT